MNAEIQVNRIAIDWYLRQGILPPSDLMESASLWQGFRADMIRDKHQFSPRGRRRRNMTDARIHAITEKEWRERTGLGETTRENGRRFRSKNRSGKTNIQRERFFSDIREHLSPEGRLPSIRRSRSPESAWLDSEIQARRDYHEELLERKAESLEDRGWRREQDDPDAPGLHFVSDRW